MPGFWTETDGEGKPVPMHDAPGLVSGQDYQCWEQATGPLPKTGTDEDSDDAMSLYGRAVHKVNQEVFLDNAAKAGLVSLAEVKAVLEYQAATQVVMREFFRDLMAALEKRFTY